MQTYLDMPEWRRKLQKYLGEDEARNAGSLWCVLNIKLCLRALSETAAPQPIRWKVRVS